MYPLPRQTNLHKNNSKSNLRRCATKKMLPPCWTCSAFIMCWRRKRQVPGMKNHLHTPRTDHEADTVCLSCLILVPAMWGRYCYHHHFADEDSRDRWQRDHGHCASRKRGASEFLPQNNLPFSYNLFSTWLNFVLKGFLGHCEKHKEAEETQTCPHILCREPGRWGIDIQHGLVVNRSWPHSSFT